MDVAGSRKFFCWLISVFLFHILQVPCRCNKFVCKSIAPICIIVKIYALVKSPRKGAYIEQDILIPSNVLGRG